MVGTGCNSILPAAHAATATGECGDTPTSCSRVQRSKYVVLLPREHSNNGLRAALFPSPMAVGQQRWQPLEGGYGAVGFGGGGGGGGYG